MQQQFFEILDEFLTIKMKFKRKGKIWYINNEKIILIIDIQYSDFIQNGFFINFGYYIPNLLLDDIKIPPKSHNCHISSRIDTISIALENIEIPKSFQLPENQELLMAFTKNLISILEEIVLPFLFKYMNTNYLIGKVNEFYEKGVFNIRKVRKDELLQFLITMS